MVAHFPIMASCKSRWQLQINEATFYSDVRELFVPGFMAFNKNAFNDITQELHHRFAKCMMMKRGGPAGVVDALPRQQFQDYLRPTSLSAGQRVADESKRRRQWHSGVAWHMHILKALLANSGLTADDLVVVKHMTLYCPSVAKACCELNCAADRVKQRRPIIYCVMAACVGYNRLEASVVSENAREEVEAFIKAKIRDGQHPRAPLNFDSSPAEGSDGTAGSEPKINTGLFKYTHPHKDSMTLMLNLEAVEMGEGLGRVSIEDPDPAKHGQMLSWAELRQECEDAYNPTGRVWDPDGRNKRAATTQAQPPKDAVTLDLLSEDQVKGLVPLTPGNTDYELSLRLDSGEVIIKSENPTYLEPSDSLWEVNGKFIQGTEAKSWMKKKGNQYFPYEVSADTEVFVAQADDQTKDLALPSGRQPLKVFLDHLAAKGEAGFTLPLHTVERQSDQTWKVQQSEDACYSIIRKKTDSNADSLDEEKFSGLVEYSKLKHVQHIHSLEYNDKTKQLKPLS